MITSTANRDIRAVRRLRIAQNRARLGLVLVEGRAAVAGVLDAGATIDRILVTPRGERTHHELQRRAHATGARKLVVHEQLMGLLCDTATPPSVLAIVPAPPATPPAPGDPWCGLLVAGEHDPRRLGGMLLAAAAIGIDAVGVARGAADPWAPKAVRASAAAGWRVPVRAQLDPAAWIDELTAEGVTAGFLEDGVPLPQALPSRFLLVTGAPGAILATQMRLEVAATSPVLPAPSGVSHILADWSRQHPR